MSKVLKSAGQPVAAGCSQSAPRPAKPQPARRVQPHVAFAREASIEAAQLSQAAALVAGELFEYDGNVRALAAQTLLDRAHALTDGAVGALDDARQDPETLQAELLPRASLEDLQSAAPELAPLECIAYAAAQEASLLAHFVGDLAADVFKDAGQHQAIGLQTLAERLQSLCDAIVEALSEDREDLEALREKVLPHTLERWRNAPEGKPAQAGSAGHV